MCSAATLPNENAFAQRTYLLSIHFHLQTQYLAGHYVRKQRLMNMYYKQLVKVQSFHTHVMNFCMLYFQTVKVMELLTT